MRSSPSSVALEMGASLVLESSCRLFSLSGLSSGSQAAPRMGSVQMRGSPARQPGVVLRVIVGAFPVLRLTDPLRNVIL